MNPPEPLRDEEIPQGRMIRRQQKVVSNEHCFLERRIHFCRVPLEKFRSTKQYNPDLSGGRIIVQRALKLA
jgi:hypothetical protein